MNTSQYQMLKIHIQSILPLSKDAIHVHLGLWVFFLWAILFKKPLKSFKTILPVLALSLVMEMLDLRDDFTAFGRFRWWASLHDIINTVFWPLLIVLIFKLKLIKR